MPGAPKPQNENARLQCLRNLEVLDSEPEQAFDQLVELASETFDAPIALISLVDEDRQWFKARVGLEATETPREHAFCAWAIHQDSLLEVADAADDPRFADNPLVTGAPGIRFYAGAPVRGDQGAVGTLCIIDQKPRQLSDVQRRMLTRLADLASHSLRTRRSEIESARRARLLDLGEQLADVGHWRLDNVLGQVSWSDNVYRIHGVTPETFSPTLESGLDAYHPDDRDRVAECVQRALDDRIPFDFQLRLRRADGSERIVRSIGVPEIDDSDAVIGLFGVFQDITEQRKLHERLVHAEKLASVGTLAAGVAHEINNPLSCVWSNAHVLAEEIASGLASAPSPRLREFAELVTDIKDGAQRIQKIVGGLRTFARPTSREVEVIDLARCIEVAERLCAGEIRQTARLAIESCAPAPVHALAHESQTVQVLVNLLVNAAHSFDKAEPDNRIVARVGHASRMAVVEVTDNGRGMTEQQVRQAFTPFYTTKPPGIGTGLGLSICHGIVTSCGGSIEIDSTPGSGTTVRVLLPTAGVATDVAADQDTAAGTARSPL